MVWHGIYGHDDVVEQFRRALRRGRLASSFLFAGPAGIGKRTFALTFAKALLCGQRPEAELDPCGVCPACVQVAAGTHPDVEQVAKPDDKAFIPLELLIGDKEHRGREGLCHAISLKPFMGGRKVAVIDDADHLNPEGANSLLKTLEEPPPRSLLILIGTSPAKQLPTIRSRCQLVRFRPLATEVVAELLLSQGTITDADEARRLAEHGQGSLQQALELADPELRAFRDRLHEQLAAGVLDSLRAAKAVAAFVDEAGKQAALRRERLRRVIGFATEFYRGLLRAQNGCRPDRNPGLRGTIARAVEHGHRNRETTAELLQRCLDAAALIGRNVNQTTLIESWLDDLARIQ